MSDSAMAERAAVVGSSLLALSEGLTSQDRSDIYSALMLAQNTTSELRRSGQMVGDWFDFYQNQLRFYGFAAKSPDVKPLPRRERSASLAALALQAVETSGDQRFIDLAARSLDSVTQRPQALALLDGAGVNLDQRMFQVVPCVAVGWGRVEMLMYHRSVVFAQEEGSLLLSTHSTQSTTVERRLEVFTFNTRYYGAFRQKVNAALDKGARRALLEFPL